MTQHVSLFHAARKQRHSRGGLAGLPRRLLLQGRKLHMQLLLLIFLFTCSWLAFIGHTQTAHVSTALSERLQHLQATFRGPVESHYSIAGGYWQLEVNYSVPTVPLLAKARYRVTNKTCWELASSHVEPLSQLYRPSRASPLVSAVSEICSSMRCRGKQNGRPILQLCCGLCCAGPARQCTAHSMAVVGADQQAAV
jgi:hypothetical protein